MSEPLNTIKLTDEEFHTLATYVHDKYGINLEQKRILIEGRMTSVLRSRGIQNFSQYLNILFHDKTGEEAIGLLNRLTTNHSFFMREPEHYDFLRNKVFPDLVGRHTDHNLRIWSAGCSAGQEAYTIAMVAEEFFGPEKPLWDTRILATDISLHILEKAKAGIYPSDNIKDLPPAWQKKYFLPLPDGQVQICSKIRKQVIFRIMNLMEPFAIKQPMDLIFCRNVMIYFDNPTKNKLIEKFYEATNPGGYFFIGHSESINRQTRYNYLEPAIYQRGAKG